MVASLSREEAHAIGEESEKRGTRELTKSPSCFFLACGIRRPHSLSCQDILQASC